MEAQTQNPKPTQSMENMEAQTQTQTPPQPTPTHLLTNPPSSCSRVFMFINLVSRILTAVLLLIALIVLATDSVSLLGADGLVYNFQFSSVVAYRYVMAAIVIGFVYTLVQTGFVLYQVITGKRLCNGKAMLLFDFYADKVLSGLLATGAGAGFGVTIDLQASFSGISEYFNKGTAVASLVLFAYFFSEASQIVSCYSLPKK